MATDGGAAAVQGASAAEGALGGAKAGAGAPAKTRAELGPGVESLGADLALCLHNVPRYWDAKALKKVRGRRAS